MTTRTAERLRIHDFLPEGKIPIQVLRREPQIPYEMHTHEFAELVLVNRGCGTHRTKSGAYPVTAGDIFVVLGNEAHGYTELRDLNLINIIYDRSRVDMPEYDIRQLPGFHALFTLEPEYRQQHRFASRLHLSLEDLDRACDLVARLETEIVYGEPGSWFMAIAVFMQMVGFLSRRYAASPSPDAGNLLGIGEVIGFLEHHYAEVITLDQLTEIAGMSKSSLLRAFRRALGVTPIDYLLRTRIDRAKELLRASEQSITDIAFDCGFRDSNYFSRQFRKATGASPSAYRRQADQS